MKRRLQQIAEAVDVRLHGDGTVEVSGVASLASASRNDVVFVEDEKYLSRALQSAAGAVIAGEFAESLFASGSTPKPLLISKHPKLAFARVARFLQDGGRQRRGAGVHATAVVHPSAHMSPGAVVGEYAAIAENAVIGDGT